MQLQPVPAAGHTPQRPSHIQWIPAEPRAWYSARGGRRIVPEEVYAAVDEHRQQHGTLTRERAGRWYWTAWGGSGTEPRKRIAMRKAERVIFRWWPVTSHQSPPR